MEHLASYVATRLLQRVQHATVDDRSAASAHFRGATMFVDISGYTDLAEMLCRDGATGVERLGAVLNRVFCAQVEAVHRYGGEVASFAGDAFLAYWAEDEADAEHILRRAEACAHALHASGASDATASIPDLKLHIGIGNGDLWAARLGRDPQWHLLLAGPAVREACAASRAAAAGETVLAPGVHALRMSVADDAAPESELASLVTDEERRHEASVPAGLDVSGLVPRRVHEYASGGYAAWIPQRRTICALFARIDGLDEGAPDALFRYQAAATSVQVALRPYTGSTGRLQLDDKGLVFTLCLGVPYDSHGDDALRAVRAGLAIRTELARLGLSASVGVAAGDGVCMPLGGSERRQYWTGGRFMHVAARLMEGTSGGVLCTEGVADQVRRSVSLTPERPLTVKGVRWPVRVFRVHDAGYADEHVDVLFGREKEQAMLGECLAAVEQGRGAVLWMVGEAGAGKTALVHYLRQAAAQRGLQCLVGGTGSVEIAVPYAAWRPVFATLFTEAEASVRDERLARLQATRHPQFVPLLNTVVPGLVDDTPLVQGLMGQARADATCGLLSDVLAQSTGGRVVLVLEDCHWLDSASWRLVLRVAQEHPQLLFVLTARPGADEQELGALRRVPRFSEMGLVPLRADAIGALVESVLQRTASRALVDEIAERAMGNPLFAREYALLLSTEAERDFREPSSAGERPADAGAVPVTVQSLIASRLDALPPAEDLALKAASVIGDTFTDQALAAVSPAPLAPDRLDALLTSLMDRQLIVRRDADTRTFAFPHALIREVTYAQLTQEQRRDLHGRCARRIEAVCSDDLQPQAAALGHHWFHAEMPEPAIRYSDQAASQALGAGAFEEAERLLQRCLSLADTVHAKVDDRVRWYRQLADARHGMGYLESRQAAAHLALRTAGIERSHSSVRLAAQAGGCLWRLALHHLSLYPIAEGDHTIDVARAFRHSGEVCYFDNRMFGMLCDSLSAVAYATALGPSAVLVGASTELGGIVSVGGLRQTGERILQRAIEMAERAGDQAAQAYGHMINCLYYIGQGDWSSAEASCQRCQELCEPMDDRVNWTNAQAVRFWMSHYRGHLGAKDAASNLLNRASETGNRQHRAWALRCLAVCALRAERFDEAVTHLKGAMDSLQVTSALNERLPTLGLLALAQWRSGDIWSARGTANTALLLVARVKRPLGQGSLEGYSSLAAVALELWEREGTRDWKRAAQDCLRVLRRYRQSFPIGEPRHEMHCGDFHRIAGDADAARARYRRGEAAALRFGMPWEARRCRQALERLGG
jgi:class 3 adenylate cyclase/tetratricopeptide (TPR) repeat protein